LEKNWLQPIQSRLALHFPYLSSSELDEYNFICKSAMDFSNKLVQSMVEIKGNKLSQKEWEEKVLLSYPWINEENLERLFSQGMYYAWK